ncbi:MAG: CoA activase, partial [bacterium]|nr:CoA activase [bacterium]
MITAGVDIGAKNIKIVVVEDGIIKAKNLTPAGYDLKESQEKAWAEIENDSGFKVGDLSKILATGIGRKNAINASKELIEVAAMAKGAFTLDASVRTIISIGADHALAARIDEDGKVIDFNVNHKCAAGTGVFIEEMARILEVSIADVGPLSLKSTQALAVNAQ